MSTRKKNKGMSSIRSTTGKTKAVFKKYLNISTIPQSNRTTCSIGLTVDFSTSHTLSFLEGE